MKILVLSLYYRPDLSAGSFRTTALVRALLERGPADLQIEVITTLPNRYSTFQQDAAALETSHRLRIQRIALPAHRSDIRGQSRAFLRFAREALTHLPSGPFDLIFATSSRLMTAVLGAWVARRMRTPLYLDLRDIFADTIAELLPAPVTWPARFFFGAVESWTVRRARRINLVSPGFENYFRRRYGDLPLSFFTNGIDDEFLSVPPRQLVRPAADRRIVILYAGNIGEGQGLHQILPELARSLRARARFVVIGDGGRRAALETALAGTDNVQLQAPMSRADLLSAYEAADVLFLHLGAYTAFEKVLPSKVFEYAALGKPLLAGVAGYAAQFIRAEISNAAVFAPCDAAAGLAAFDSLRIEDQPRPDFVAKYARNGIMQRMADDVLSVASRRS